MKNESSPEKSQLERFKEAARELGTDDDEERFNKKLKKVVTAVENDTVVQGRSPDKARLLQKIEKVRKKLDAHLNTPTGSLLDRIAVEQSEKLAKLEDELKQLND